MSDTITPEERAELRELAAGATPGEWTGQGNPCGSGWVRIPCKNMLGLYRQALLGPYVGAEEDARYIAAACTLAPRLLNALEAAEASKAEAEAENARLRAEMKDMIGVLEHLFEGRPGGVYFQKFEGGINVALRAARRAVSQETK